MSDFHKFNPYFHIPQSIKELDICTSKLKGTEDARVLLMEVAVYL